MTAKRCEEAKPFDIKNCMRQHMMVFETGKNVILKEYLCECDPCRRFQFGECENKDSEADLKGPRQRGVTGRWRIWRKSRWTDLWFRRDTIVRNFIHCCQRRTSLLFEDYWKREFRWNSYGYLRSSSTARVRKFQRELFETRSLTKHFLQKNSIYCLCLLS